MATIQIRDVPDDVHRRLARLAQDSGQSLQAFMRQKVVEMADERGRAEAIRQLEGFLTEHGGVGATAEEIVADVRAARR